MSALLRTLWRMLRLTGGDHRHGDALGGCAVCDTMERRAR
jgi:hypothetical protein